MTWILAYAIGAQPRTTFLRNRCCTLIWELLTMQILGESRREENWTTLLGAYWPTMRESLTVPVLECGEQTRK